MKTKDVDARVAPLGAGAAPQGSTASGNEASPPPVKFTPGPWQVGVQDKYAGGENPHRISSYQIFGPSTYVAHIYAADIDAETLPNARLIAAAPDLLTAAQRVLCSLKAHINGAPGSDTRVKCGWGFDSAICTLETAIAKAERP